jgi:phospholipid transport system substrate-binding protein
MKRLVGFAVLIFALSSPVTFARAEALAPVDSSGLKAATDVVKKFYAQLTDVMKEGDKLGFSGRYKKLEPIIQSTFNLPAMTRYAVGLVWTKATPDEQRQLTAAFSDFSVANYANQFRHYDGEHFEVDEAKLAGNNVIVETKLEPKDGGAVALNYLMRLDEKGHYRIIDVFLDGAISELATRRSEFSAIANRDGVAALVNSLGDKAKQMGPS